MAKSFRSKILLGLTIAFGLSATASAQMMINGAGATFPYPIYSKWFDEYAKVDPSVRLNYQSMGSSAGQNPAYPDGRGRGGDQLQSRWQSCAQTRRRNGCRHFPWKNQKME